MTKVSSTWPYLVQSGWIHGQNKLAQAAGYRSPHYFIKKIRNDPTAAFIVAVGVDFDTSVNSVPPGKDFVVVSIPSSLHAWKITEPKWQTERRNVSGLIRWKAASTDVSSGSTL